MGLHPNAPGRPRTSPPDSVLVLGPPLPILVLAALPHAAVLLLWVCLEARNLAEFKPKP